ncbi:unnamed protein product [Camellia sinensis]
MVAYTLQFIDGTSLLHKMAEVATSKLGHSYGGTNGGPKSVFDLEDFDSVAPSCCRDPMHACSSFSSSSSIAMRRLLLGQSLAQCSSWQRKQSCLGFISSLQSLPSVGLPLASPLLGTLESLASLAQISSNLPSAVLFVQEIDEPAMIPHIAEASSRKYPYEVLFRSLHKLLMDTASSEYLFCDDFFGKESIFYEIFAGIIMSRRRIPCLDSYLDKINIALWPRFKMVFDMHLSSLRNANVKTLWEDDVHPHYVMRRYAEFTASLIHLNVEYGDGQLDLNLERLRMAIDDLLVKLAKMFPKPKLQTVFLINNYDMTIAILKEAGAEGGKIQLHFEELLKNNTAIFVVSNHSPMAALRACLHTKERLLKKKQRNWVSPTVEELLLEHFSDLIKFVKTRASEDPTSGPERAITVSEVEPLVKDFASRWKAAIELMHNDVITSFSNFLCGMEILRAALTQLLLYYTRLTDCIKRIVGGTAPNKDLVSISSIMYEIKKYSRTF